MAQIGNVYQEDLTEGSQSGLTYVTQETVLGSLFEGTTDYIMLVMARVGGDNAAGRFQFRTQIGGTTPQGAEMILEPATGVAGTSGEIYTFMHRFTTASTPDAITFQMSAQQSAGDTAFVDTVIFIALKLDDLVAADFAFGEDTTVSDHATGGTFDNRASITFTPGTAGNDWLVMAWASVHVNSANKNFRYRINHEGDLEPLMSREGEDSDEEFPLFIVRPYNLTAIEHTFTVQSNDDSAGGVENQHNISKIIAIRLQAFQNSITFFNGGTFNTPDTNFNELADLAFTPDNTGDVLVVGTTMLFPDTAGQLGVARVQLAGVTQPIGSDLREVSAFDATDLNPCPVLVRFGVTASVLQDIDIDGQVSDALADFVDRGFVAFTLELAAVVGLIEVINETESISEVLVKTQGLIRIRNETENIQEEIISTRSMIRVLNETEDISETLTKSLALLKITNETIDIQEGIIQALGKVQVVDETIDILEGNLRILSFVRIVNEIEEVQGGAGGSVTLDLQVVANADDIRHNSDHVLDQLIVAVGASTPITLNSAVRFTNVTIPKSATIDVAFLIFTPDATRDTANVNSNIHGHAADDSGQITNDTEWHDVEDTNLTSSFTAWDAIPTWTIDVEINSPSIVDVIQEIVDRSGWVSGNALNIMWLDDGSSNAHTRRAYQHDVDTGKAVKLHIEYTPSGTEVIKVLDIVRLINESENIPEGVVRIFALIRLVDETIDIVESPIKVSALIRVFDETINITEGVLNALGKVQVIDEVVNVSEGNLRILNIVRVSDDVIEISETLVKLQAIARVINENENIQEGTIKTRTLLRLIDETEDITEALTKVSAFTRIVNETINILENIVPSRILLRVLNETVNIIEGVIRVLSIPVVGLQGFLSANVNVNSALTATVKAASALLGGVKINDE